MYHEEKIIDGILHHRGTPDGDWVPFTLEALTIALTAERVQRKLRHAAWIEATAKLELIQVMLGDRPPTIEQAEGLFICTQRRRT